jgi:hypothetical protein
MQTVKGKSVIELKRNNAAKSEKESLERYSNPFPTGHPGHAGIKLAL